MIKNLKSIKNMDLLLVNSAAKSLKKNRLSVYISLFIFASPFLLLRIPYLNLYINLNLVWPIIFAMVFLMLNISVRIGIYLTIFLFTLCPLFIIFRSGDSAEFIGNVIFFMLWIIWAKAFREYLSKSKK